MKKTTFLVFLLLLTSLKGYSQKSEDITGFWLTKDEKTNEPTSQIQIFLGENGKYYGKVVWLYKPLKNNQPLKDEKNPEVKNRNNPVLGLQILKDFIFTQNGWSNGTIYDPETGNTYKCKIWFEKNNKNLLYLRGFIGVSLLGRNTQWIREVKKR